MDGLENDQWDFKCYIFCTLQDKTYKTIKCGNE